MCVCVFIHIYMNNTYVNPGGGGTQAQRGAAP